MPVQPNIQIAGWSEAEMSQKNNVPGYQQTT
jgi:hypothetical protein